MVTPLLAEVSTDPNPSILALNVENTEVAKGKTVKLVATVTGDAIPVKPAYKWQSSDKKIATVQSGTVTGVAAGTATITVSLKIDEATVLSASCQVRVYVPVSSISTKEKAITLNVGSTFNPNIAITPKTATNQNLIWKSDKENVATVSDKGVIKAVKSGECVVTATTIDGSNKSLSVKVFVPTLSTTAKEVNLTAFRPSVVRVKYYSNKSNISLDDKEARNNLYCYDFKDGVLEIRIWPWATGTSTLTISDSSSPKSTVKIKITTSRDAGLNSREAFPNINNEYRDAMRYGEDSGYFMNYYYAKVRVMQAYNGSDTSWILGYSKGKYDDLVYISFPNKEADKHKLIKGENLRVQEDDVIEAWVKLDSVYSYETTMGATNYALQLKPMLMYFENGGLLYMDNSIYK